MSFNFYYILNHSKILILLYFILLINPIKNACYKNKPILKSNSCSLQYCTEEEYKNETCKIDNKNSMV